MDIAILGTLTESQRLARICLQAIDTEADGGITSVRLYGSDATEVMDAVDAIEESLDNSIAPAPDARMDRLEGTTDLETAVGDADVIVDTRTGDIETIRKRLAKVEELADPSTAIGVQNQQSEVTSVAVALENPDRLVGISLVGRDKGGAVEIVRADQTEEEAIETVKSFVTGIGWSPAVVHDEPGCISRRLALALEVEAMRAVQAEVASPETIDSLMENGFGMDEGPLRSADRASLDERLQSLEALSGELGPRFEPPAILEAKVDAGQLGEKTGLGFYEWDN